MSLASLPILDLAQKIARLPKRTGYQTLPQREPEQFITFHYSGVAYADRSRATELARVLDEARFHLSKNWGSKAEPAFGDGLMYDLVVLSDGTIVRTRARRQCLWHAGNKLANQQSWSVHVMLGPGQDMTPAQQNGVITLFDVLCDQSGIPRENVIAHCEWPRGTGLPERTAIYTVRKDGQSACPGPILFPVIATYREVRSGQRYVVRNNNTWTRTSPERTPNNRAWATLPAGREVMISEIVADAQGGSIPWGHWVENGQGQAFIRMDQLIKSTH